MLARCPIRTKLLLGAGLLFLIVATLSFSGIRGVSSYRRLVRSVSNRAAELPLADKLTRSVNDLRMTFSQIRSTREIGDRTQYDPVAIRERFILDLIGVKDALRRYRRQLQSVEHNGSAIVDNRDEWESVRKIERTLEHIDRFNQEEDWFLDQVEIDWLGEELETLHQLANDLPSHLQHRMQELKGNVRGQYHALIAMTWTTSILASVMLGTLVKLFYDWVFRPLRVLIRGSRRVAGGDFDHRIELRSHDEMAELAAAMNDMTARFQQIRDDLDQQVKQRTREAVRSEQLASVGFLAAGVAHEINNPLASIAWCAEALESRLHEQLYVPAGGEPLEASLPDDPEDVKVLQTYLRRIQDEAFRCKGITEGLLDFSRLGDVERHDTDIRALVTDVIDMVRHLGRFRNKQIAFSCDDAVVAHVNGQEIKQVVLNLIANALDSLDENGCVEVSLRARDGDAQLVVRDNGCGMTDEVLEHLFEPFFTRRRSGQGIGLGLSITYRIIIDHGGTIQASSAGPGRGSEFRVSLPLSQHEEIESTKSQRAA